LGAAIEKERIMPPGAIPERIWKTDDLQRLDDLLGATNGRSEKERDDYLGELQALDDPQALQALKDSKKYPDPWPNVIGPDLAITRWYGVYGDPNSPDAILTEQHMRNDWYTDKSLEQNPQTGQRGWWSHNVRVSDLLRQAVIQAGTLAKAKQLPVDTYWVSAGLDTGDGYTTTPFQCFVIWNPRQIMLFILTPGVPTGYQFAAPKQAERSTLQITVPFSKPDVNNVVTKMQAHAVAKALAEANPARAAADELNTAAADVTVSTNAAEAATVAAAADAATVTPQTVVKVAEEVVATQAKLQAEAQATAERWVRALDSKQLEREATGLGGLSEAQQAALTRKLMSSPDGRKHLLDAGALDKLANTPEGRRVLLTTEDGRKQLLKTHQGRLMLLRTSEGQQTLAKDKSNKGPEMLQSASTLDGRQALTQSLEFGMTIVGGDEYGDVLAWPTRANAPYWLKDQYNPSRQPPIDGAV
jgi:hypothetical protein